jgi:hypothetical protein
MSEVISTFRATDGWHERTAPSVALSADGRVVMLGASNDNGGVGAAWVFVTAAS